jgi:hypothetical protein
MLSLSIISCLDVRGVVRGVSVLSSFFKKSSPAGLDWTIVCPLPVRCSLLWRKVSTFVHFVVIL